MVVWVFSREGGCTRGCMATVRQCMATVRGPCIHCACMCNTRACDNGLCAYAPSIPLLLQYSFKRCRCSTRCPLKGADWKHCLPASYCPPTCGHSTCTTTCWRTCHMGPTCTGTGRGHLREEQHHVILMSVLYFLFCCAVLFLLYIATCVVQ